MPAGWSGTRSETPRRPAGRRRPVRPRRGRYLTAVRYLLIEHARNRLAIVLLIAFVPIWYLLVSSIIPSDPVDFRFRVTGNFIRVDGRELSLLTTGLNALTLIVGFVIFTSTRRGMRFDHRLVLSGYPQWIVIGAKVTSLAVVASLVSLYTSGVLLFFWRPQSVPLVIVSYAGAALAYGSLGLFLGVLLRGELEGFFLVIMVSLIDTFIQNPIGNPAANKDFVRLLPTYASTQLYVTGGFSDLVPLRFIALMFAWPIALALCGLLIFWLRTRVPWSGRAHPAPGLVARMPSQPSAPEA